MKKILSVGLFALLVASVFVIGTFAIPASISETPVKIVSHTDSKVNVDLLNAELTPAQKAKLAKAQTKQISTTASEVNKIENTNRIPASILDLANNTNGTNPGNNTNVTNVSYVSGCSTLSPVILNRVAELQSLGNVIVKQELNRVNKGEYLLVPGFLLKVVTITNSTGYSSDGVIFRDSIGGEQYETVITSEGTGVVNIGANTYIVNYVRGPADDGYVKVNFPQTVGGTIMTFNCNFQPFPVSDSNFTLPDNEVIRGENMIFFAEYPESYAGILNDGFNFEVSNGSDLTVCHALENDCNFLTTTAFVQNGTVHRVLFMNTSNFNPGVYYFLGRVFYNGSEVFVSQTLSGRILPNDLVGDINHDGRVNNLDLSILLYMFGKPETGDADLNHDGRVDFIDLNLLLSNWTTY